MSDLDNRIDLSQMPVDFDKSGTTGGLHDNYPAPNTSARYDLMRAVLIGLLSNQSSNEETDGQPNEKRIGTLWYKKQSKLLNIFDGEEFVNLANHIGVLFNNEVKNLQEVIFNINASYKYVAPRLIWSGIFTIDSPSSIPIPQEYQGYSNIKDIGVLIYVDGLLIDPRSSVIISGNPSFIHLSNINIKSGSKFTVIMEHISDIKQQDVVSKG